MRARIKGTDIIVKCSGVDTKGICCRYLTGKFKGSYETIPADCLIEIDNDKEQYKSLVIQFTSAQLANYGIPRTHDFKEEMIKAAFELADEITKRLKKI